MCFLQKAGFGACGKIYIWDYNTGFKMAVQQEIWLYLA